VTTGVLGLQGRVLKLFQNLVEAGGFVEGALSSRSVGFGWVFV